MHDAHAFLLVGGALGLACVFIGLLAGRLGTPVLLVFLGLGMLAGEDGPGGIRFDDFRSTYLLGSLALVVILLEGGLKTSTAMIRSAFRPAFALATVGVAITAGVVGATVVAMSGLSWPAGLLLGALVAPTDAAAVASVLRASRVAVPHRVLAVLEVESGINDPMSVFLTVLLVRTIALPQGFGVGAAAELFAVEMLGGAAVGIAGGWLLVQAVKRLKIEPALHPVLLLSAGLALFGGAQMLDASGFLAVYAAGVMVGNQVGARPAESLEPAFEAFAWVAQIGLFLMLGLLVTPHDLVSLILPSVALAVVLMLVARPLATVLCLKPFGFSWSETGFVGWVGLRGGVPIYLAIIPVLDGLPNSERGFATAFVIVLTSLAVQGWTIAPVARLLKLGRGSAPTPVPITS